MFKFKCPKENYKTGAERTRTYYKIEVVSGTMEELASSADQSHPPCSLCCNWEKRNVRTQLGDKLWS